MYTWGYIKNNALAKLDINESEAVTLDLLGRFSYYANEVITQVCSSIKPKHTFFTIDITTDKLFTPIKMPNNFISFGDDNNIVVRTNCDGTRSQMEVTDEDFRYNGYNELVFYTEGLYSISYNARWITFDTSMEDDTLLDVPTDILECIPSYIASQGYKIDDENKAAIYRNEYEMFLSRIDDTNFENTKHIKITGGW